MIYIYDKKTIGLSKVNIEVDFIELSKTEEYQKCNHLQKVNVGDRVIVRYKDFDIDIKVPVIKIRKDVLRGLNAKVELGQSSIVKSILENEKYIR